MHRYLMAKVEEAMDRRDAVYEELKTPEQLAAYQERKRRFFIEALGGFPERRPLNPRIVAAESSHRIVQRAGVMSEERERKEEG